MRLLNCLLAGSSLVLTSCAGYHLGGTKPLALAHVEKIHVPLASNSTQIPRAAAFVTNGVVDALTLDGTYRVASDDAADAILEVELHEVDFRAVRTTQDNRLRSTEQSMTVVLRWKVLDSESGTKVLDSGVTTGPVSYTHLTLPTTPYV